LTLRVIDSAIDGIREAKLDKESALEAFLMEVQRKGYQMARLAIGDRDEAFDLVQDAMMKLVQRYAGRRPEEWRPLFYRILNNRIMDHHRQRAGRGKWMRWLRPRHDEDGDDDPVARVADADAPLPEHLLALDVAGEEMARAVEALPLRQKQAFLLRAWEGFSVSETAAVMKCSEGSVKTHYSRAVHQLRKVLEAHYERR